MKLLALILSVICCLIGCGDEGEMPTHAPDARDYQGLASTPALITAMNEAEAANGHLGLMERTRLLSSLASRSVVFISVQRYEDQKITYYSGSGFCVLNNWIVTNYHVIKNALKIEVLTVFGTEKYPLTDNTLFTDEAHDLAVFQVDDLILPALQIGDSSKLVSGEWVAAMGNPFSYRGMFSVGVLSQIYGGNALVQDSVMFFSLSTERGSSGGPILNMSGKVVGIVVGGYLYREMFTFGIPTKFLINLILFAEKSLNPIVAQR